MVQSSVRLVASADIYSAMDGEAAEFLRDTAARIREFCRASAIGLVQVGQQLSAVKTRLKRYTFRRWVQAELPWSRTQCYRLMATAEVFGVLIDPLARPEPQFDPTALYLLASPQVPNEARELAIRAACQSRVTVAAARQIIRATRPRQEESSAKELQLYDRTATQLQLDEGSLPPDSVEEKLRAWDALDRLYRDSEIVHVARIEEGEEDEDAGHPLASVTIYSENDRPRNAVRRRLSDAILAAAGLEPEKLCKRCGVSKPLSDFGDNLPKPDGRNRYCRVCERQRTVPLKRESRRKARECE